MQAGAASWLAYDGRSLCDRRSVRVEFIMSNFKSLVAAALLCGVAVVSFAQVPAPAKAAGASVAVSPAEPAAAKKAHAPAKKMAAKKHVAKKVHKNGVAKKSASVVPAA